MFIELHGKSLSGTGSRQPARYLRIGGSPRAKTSHLAEIALAKAAISHSWRSASIGARRDAVRAG